MSELLTFGIILVAVMFPVELSMISIAIDVSTIAKYVRKWVLNYDD